MPPTSPANGIKWSADVNVGSLLEKAIYAAVAVGLYVASGIGKADLTAQQLASFRAEIVTKLAETQADNKSRFEDLSKQVSGLPDQSATLRQLDLRVTRLETARTDRDKQLSDMAATILQDHADLAAMQSASRQKLGTIGR